LLKSALYAGSRMATQKQIEANRRNAQKSTGPKTEQGKTKSKFNALKHGMTAEVAVLPHEDKTSYEELRQATIESYQPANGAELMLVDLIAINYWRLLRARRVETATLDLHVRGYKRRHGVSPSASLDDDSGIATAFADPENGLGNINRYQTTVERAYLRAVETLRKTQNDRLRRERQNGFVPQSSSRGNEVSKTTTYAPVPTNYPHLDHMRRPSFGGLEGNIQYRSGSQDPSRNGFKEI
jgi:hypothetical protein